MTARVSPTVWLKQHIPLGSRILSVVRDYIAYLDGSKTGEDMPVSAAIGQLMTLKGSYYDPDIVDTFVKVLKDTTLGEDVEVEFPVLNKSWENSKLFNGLQNAAMERPVIEISWMCNLKSA